MPHPYDEMYREYPLVNVGERYRIRAYPVNHGESIAVDFVGHDLGPRLSIARQADDVLIIRCGGHSTFASRAERAYVPTQYWRLAVERTDSKYTHARVVDVLIPGRNRKAAERFINAE